MKSFFFFCVRRFVVSLENVRLAVISIFHKIITLSASIRPPLVIISLVSISVAEFILQGRVAGPTPNPPPFSSGLGTGNGGVTRNYGHP